MKRAAQRAVVGYESSKGDIQRITAAKREEMAVTMAVKFLIDNGIEPEMDLRTFAERYREGDLRSVQSDMYTGKLPSVGKVSIDKREKRKVNMVAYFARNMMGSFAHLDRAAVIN